MKVFFFVQDYIHVKEKGAVFLPHTSGRYAKKRFRKAQVCLSPTQLSICFVVSVPYCGKADQLTDDARPQ